MSQLWGLRFSPRGEVVPLDSLEDVRSVAFSMKHYGREDPVVLQRSAEGAPWRPVAESTWVLG